MPPARAERAVAGPLPGRRVHPEGTGCAVRPAVPDRGRALPHRKFDVHEALPGAAFHAAIAADGALVHPAPAW